MRSPGMILALLLFTVAATLCTDTLSASAEGIDPNHSSDPSTSLYLPAVHGPPPAKLIIAAAHIDSAISYEPDEALLLANIGGSEQALAGWQITANSRAISFPLTSTLSLAPGRQLWCAAQAESFARSFGFSPGCEWAEESDAAVPNLDGSLTMVNSGGNLQLRDASGQSVDVLLYGDEEQPIDGWDGVAAQAYDRGAIGRSGQIWHRKLDPVSRQPMDSDSPDDWAGDLADLRWGRRVRRPGWLPSDGMPQVDNVSATATIAVGPEGLYQPIAETLASATETIDLSLYTFEHPELAQILADAAGRGVRVRLLLEGAPAGGIDDLQKWCVAQIVAAGGDVRFMAAIEEAPNGYRPRYSFLHAKYGIIDGRRVFNGTENFTHGAMPVAYSETGGGRRGFYLFTDALPVIEGLQTLFDHDWSPERFLDLHPYDPTHSRYGGPPDDFAMPEPSTYEVESSPFHEPVAATGDAAFSVVSAPENALHPEGGILGLLAEAGAGDEILGWQLYEHRHWGQTTSNPVADPNPRLDAIVSAARRGARVRLLLDSYFDDGDALRSNRVTADYLRTLAAVEGLDMEVRLGNPTGGGIHAKVILVRRDGAFWSAVGSLNGGEVSHKLNREVVLLTNAYDIHARLAEVFAWDWARSD